jgi:dihydroflavonol-4-reductase
MDGVFHLAGYISTRRSNRKRIYRENFLATKTLWETLREVRFSRKIVYLASIFALAGDQETPVDENSPYNLADAPVDYFRAKRKAELETLKFVEAGELAITFVYPTFCLGPGDLRLSSSRLLWLYLNMPVPVGFSGGWNLLDVRDAAQGLILGFERGKPGEKTILAGKNLTFAETFALLDELTGLGQPWLYLGGRSLHIVGRLFERIRFPYLDTATIWISSRFWYYTGRKAETEWGFQVRPLEETLRDAILFFLDRNMIRSSRRQEQIRKRLLSETLMN